MIWYPLYRSIHLDGFKKDACHTLTGLGYNELALVMDAGMTSEVKPSSIYQDV